MTKCWITTPPYLKLSTFLTLKSWTLITYFFNFPNCSKLTDIKFPEITHITDNWNIFFQRENICPYLVAIRAALQTVLGSPTATTSYCTNCWVFCPCWLCKWWQQSASGSGGEDVKTCWGEWEDNQLGWILEWLDVVRSVKELDGGWLALLLTDHKALCTSF